MIVPNGPANLVQNFMTNRRANRILILVMIAASLLRAQYLLQIEHNIDHAYPIWQALQTLERGALPLTGQSTSVLFANPALTGYLYLPLIALTRSPFSVYVLVIALNSLAVLLAFRATKSVLGIWPALIAAALMAVNPWVIEYSRTSWVQSLLPFFACATAWMLWPVLLGRSKKPFRRTLLALLLLTAMTQTYLLAFLMAIPVALLLAIFRRRVSWRAAALGAAIFAAATLIYTAALLAQRDAIQGRMNDFAARPAQFSAEAWGHALRLVSGGDYALARGKDAPIADWSRRQDLSQIAHYLVAAALLLGLARAARGALARQSAAVLLLVWFGLPVLLMSYVGQPVHPFYQLLGLPAGYALAAWGISTIFRADSLWGKWALFVLYLPFAILMGINSARYYQETAALPGAHGTTALSLEYGLRLGQKVNEFLPPDGTIFFDDSPWILSSFAGRSLDVIRYTRAPQFYIIPAAGGVYAAMQAPDENKSALPAPAMRAEVITLPDRWTITLDLFTADAARQVAIEHPILYHSEQGLTFLGYDLQRAGGPNYDLTTYWRVDAVSLETAGWLYAPFAHLFDAAGKRVQIADGLLAAGEHWRPGDVHVHHLNLTVPGPGCYTVAVGQYDAVHERSIVFLPGYEILIALPTVLSAASDC